MARDPESAEDGESRVLASVECYMAAKPESLAFHLEATEVDGISTYRIIWDGASSHDANAILANPHDGERGAFEEAMDILESEFDGAVPNQRLSPNSYLWKIPLANMSTACRAASGIGTGRSLRARMISRKYSNRRLN